jgi:hypothetical protein
MPSRGAAPCSSGACSVLSMPTLSWHWLCSPGACAGHALLELVLAMIFYLLLYWVSSPASTDAVTISGCDVLFKLYDLTVKLDHACVVITISFSY